MAQPVSFLIQIFNDAFTSSRNVSIKLMMNNPSLHRAGGLLLLVPGTLIVAYAATADLLVGGRLWADWGTGQTILTVLGFMVLLCGWMTHSKAVKDEAKGQRRYQRTVLFMPPPKKQWVADRCRRFSEAWQGKKNITLVI